MKSNNRTQYFKCIETGDTKVEHISNANFEVARRLGQRDYDRKVIKCTQEWLNWID